MLLFTNKKIKKQPLVTSKMDSVGHLAVCLWISSQGSDQGPELALEHILNVSPSLT